MEIGPEWLRVILKLLEIDPEHFFNVKLYSLNISLHINSQNPKWEKNSKSNFKSQHLVINLDLGPTLKCAPGHNSIKDSSIIKSYCLKNGVMDSEIWFSDFRQILGGANLNRFAMCRPLPSFIFWKSLIWEHLNHASCTSSGWGSPLLGSRVFPN